MCSRRRRVFSQAGSSSTSCSTYRSWYPNICQQRRSRPINWQAFQGFVRQTFWAMVEGITQVGNLRENRKYTKFSKKSFLTVHHQRSQQSQASKVMLSSVVFKFLSNLFLFFFKKNTQSRLYLAEGALEGANINRSPTSYLANPEEERRR